MTNARSTTGEKKKKKPPKDVKRAAKPEQTCLGHGNKKCSNFCKTGDTCLRKNAKCEIKHPAVKTTATTVVT